MAAVPQRLDSLALALAKLSARPAISSIRIDAAISILLEAGRIPVAVHATLTKGEAAAYERYCRMLKEASQPFFESDRDG
jgi:hypothetical protein